MAVHINFKKVKTGGFLNIGSKAILAMVISTDGSLVDRLEAILAIKDYSSPEVIIFDGEEGQYGQIDALVKLHDSLGLEQSSETFQELLYDEYYNTQRDNKFSFESKGFTKDAAESYANLPVLQRQ